MSLVGLGNTRISTVLCPKISLDSAPQSVEASHDSIKEKERKTRDKLLKL